MKQEQLKKYVEHGNEIEFKFNSKMYSITYGRIDGKEVISVCEFYKETTEVETFEELLQISIDGYSLAEMWNSLTDDDIWIY